MAKKNKIPFAPVFVEIGPHKLTVQFGPDHEMVYARTNRCTILLNTSYGVKISDVAARREHRFGCILHAVARMDCPYDPLQADILAAEYRKFHHNLKDQIADLLDLNS